MKIVAYTYCKNIISLFVFVIILNMNAQDSTSFRKEYSLKEVTVTANKIISQTKDVSTRVEILDTKEIEASNGSRLPSILKHTSGTFIKSYGLTSALQTISINGLGAEHTLILVDGVRLNSFQNSTVDLSIIPKEDIERIEIINNGVSSIYGSDALGGVVNIITKNRTASINNYSTNINASYSNASYNTNQYTFGVYQQLGNFNARVYYNSEKSDGNFKYHYDNGIESILKERENGQYLLYDVGVNAQYIISNKNLLRFISSYSNQDKNVPGIETGSASAKTKQIDRNWNNILILENTFSNTLSLKNSFNFQNNFQRYIPGGILTNSYYKNIVYAVASEIQLRKDRYGFTTGYNYLHAYLNSNELEDGAKRNQHALFVSSFYNVFSNLKILPSARYDYISDINKGAATYRFGINYQPFSDMDFSIKGNAGKNFRSPSFNDLYWKNSGNKDLKPEESTNLETGLFYAFSNFVDAHFELTYTFISATNKIVWTPQSNGLWAPENVAKSESNNFNIASKISRQLTNNLSFSINAGLLFVNSKKTSASYKGDQTVDKYVPYVPLQSANVNLGIKYRLVDINVFYTHTGERFSDYANRRSMSPVNLLDGNIGIQLKLFDVTSKLRLEVNNVFNKDYELVSGYPMPLRNYRLTFSINY